MDYGILFAILSPLFYALVNMFDKYTVSHRVSSPIGYTVVVGLVNFLLATIIALFLDWSSISLNSILFPALSGILIGIAAFFYILLLQKEDISHMAGLFYTYPILVAILSFAVLNEKLSVLSYAGVGLIIIGALLLSLRIKQVRLETSAWFILVVIITTALNEFFIKIATSSIGVWQGIIVNNAFCGLTLLCSVSKKSVRTKFLLELRNVPFEIISASLVFGGVSTLFFAMTQLPATIVSSIAAIQPLAVLVFERITEQFIGKITKDKRLLHKAGAIVLIVVGVMLLYLNFN